MEHFEMHVEQTQDLLLEVKEKGKATFDNLDIKFELAPITQDHLAFIDELSGLKDLTEIFINSNNIPLAQ